MTLQNLINAALRELNVIDSTEDAGTDDTADALDILNRMFAAWALDSKDFHWQSQTDATQDAPVPDWALDGIISGLAVSAAPEFNSVVSQQLRDRHDKNLNLISRTFINLNLDPALLDDIPTGRDSYYNIETGNPR